MAEADHKIKFGIYRLSHISDQETLRAIESDIGTHIAILSYFRAWNYCRIENDLQWLHEITDTDRTVMITWEPWLIPADSSNPQNQPNFSLKTILAGQHDHYIEQFAHAVSQLSRHIILRPMHEMNGFWYPWCGTVNGNSPADFIKTWLHLRGIFNRVGATNVKWVWSPYASSYPNTGENRIPAYFPGDEFLDMAALDGYNWGSSRDWSVWKEFAELFGDGYDQISALTSKPLMVAETACAEDGGSKAEWIDRMFESLQERFGKVETLIWFDVDKECDWRISSSKASLNAFMKKAQYHFSMNRRKGRVL